MDKGTRTIVGEPARNVIPNCTNCVNCTNLHEEDKVTLSSSIVVRALCGSCKMYGIEVCEFDCCSNYKADPERKIEI